jgi:cyclopropane-fatty-acyl-phospholipid synthase
MSIGISLLERGWVPDQLIRNRIRKYLNIRLQEESKLYSHEGRLDELLEIMRHAPLAIETAAANEQHYEVPAAFYQKVLGENLKYSCCYWDEHTNDLNKAEAQALRMTCERAELQNGMDILELGCGWGSLTLYMATHYPNARITAVSNSNSQREHIMAQCAKRGLNNVEVITCDMNVFAAGKTYDRIVSVEMFEHMRNWELLLSRIRTWLKPEGKLFIHIFTHRQYTYFYEYKDESDWMSKYFFTGGIMPGEQLLSKMDQDLTVQHHWTWSGTHYQKTAEAWLSNMDRHKKELMPVLEKTYGKNNGVKWWNYWRVFFMACAELWGHAGGKEWTVSHYLLEAPKPGQ